MNMKADQIPAVAIDSVVKYYDEVRAVSNVNIDIAEGEFVTLLGPSGCGKSTLLRMISGFLEPTSGDIRLNGRSVLGVPPFKRNTSLVFQDYALFPHRTVAQNLAFGLRMRRTPAGEIKRKVGEMLDMLGLPDMGNRRISEISGGQAQRVALGRALIVEPAVLLLDEPLGALDFKLRKQMQSELKRIQRQLGATFIYVTHDQEEALTMSDRIAVMNLGEVEQLAPPEDVYKRPATSFVADFVGETNVLEITVEAVVGRKASVRDAQGHMLEANSFAATPPLPGSHSKLVIRPEQITLKKTTGKSTTRLSGTVDEVVFSGATARVFVRVSNNERFHASITDGEDIPAISEMVDLDWDSDAAVLV